MILNLGSLLLGIIAWTLPVINLMQRNTASRRTYAVFSATSLVACSIALCLQLFELNHRINIHDWSALLDTSRAVASVAALLLIGTIILNAIVIVKHSAKRQNGD